MYDLQSCFDEDSEEFKTLEYRICCGQLIQQDTIDKIKGIVAKPMPKTWYDWHSLSALPDDRREFYRRILANKKPYFMKYIYPTSARDYSSYLKQHSRNCMVKFGYNVEELMDKAENELSEAELWFLQKFNNALPLQRGNCIINKICKIFEDNFDSVKERRPSNEFDITVLKTDAKYTEAEFKAIKKLCKQYMEVIGKQYRRLRVTREERLDFSQKIQQTYDSFSDDCIKVCPNDEVRCNLIIDIAYGNETGKDFAWRTSGEEIVQQLLRKFGTVISFPVRNDDGDIEYGGDHFEMFALNVED